MSSNSALKVSSAHGATPSLEPSALRGKLDALDRVQAIIEFSLEGEILTANDNFLAAMGYDRDEVEGQHHSMFCEPEYAKSPDYKMFWKKLGRGEFHAGEFRRLGKGGKEVWINAAYTPVLDDEGKPVKVVKFATDITASKLKNAEYESKLNAISKSQAVIEFTLEGIILTANENFLKTVGYSLDEIRGQHHRLFVDPELARSPEYANLWRKLKNGDFDSGRFRRIGRGGKIIWIQASYNPVLDANGKPYKVVKFAADVTEQVNLEEQVVRKAKEDQAKVDLLLKEVSRAAAGDLSVDIAVNGQDPIDRLADGLKKMLTDLRGVISRVISTASSFTGSTREIADQSNSVASGAQSLGATVEEMNASVEELTASIASIAENTRKANDLAKATQKEAESGSQAISKSIEAMDLINKSSEDISEIIKVISEIASQTNLLAFNAAIEAARAGEHGLGFSVVADEVRKLAERSAQAAKEISKLINESVKRVEQGSAISKLAGEAFGKIVGGIEKTTQSISEISVAAEEQSEAARGVSSAINHVASEAERSAMASENIASKTRELAQESVELNAMVSKFVV